jgi:hypothetical protein
MRGRGAWSGPRIAAVRRIGGPSAKARARKGPTARIAPAPPKSALFADHGPVAAGGEPSDADVGGGDDALDLPAPTRLISAETDDELAAFADFAVAIDDDDGPGPYTGASGLDAIEDDGASAVAPLDLRGSMLDVASDTETNTDPPRGAAIEGPASGLGSDLEGEGPRDRAKAPDRAGCGERKHSYNREDRMGDPG